MLKNLIVVGGSAMIMKEIADRVRQTRIDREKTLRLQKAGILALGVTIGCTVGALAGVLFAPKAGEETREDLIRRGCEVWGKIRENASHTGHLVEGFPILFQDCPNILNCGVHVSESDSSIAASIW
jgi:hypothetical protein